MKASRRRMRWLGALAVLALLGTWGLLRNADRPPTTDPPTAEAAATAGPETGGPDPTEPPAGPAEPATDLTPSGASRAQPLDAEPNDTVAQASSFQPGEWIAGQVGADHIAPPERDVDTYVLAVHEGGHLTVRLHADRNKTVVVRDADGAELLRERQLDIVREVVADGDGALFVEVTGQAGSYTLCVDGRGTTCWGGVARIAGGDPHTRTAELSMLQPTDPFEVVLVSSRPTELTVAAALAVQRRAPLLSRPVVGISQVVGVELARLRPEHIIVLGGVESTPNAIVRAAAGFARGPAPLDVTLLRGDDEVETAAAAAIRFPVGSPVAYVMREGDSAAAIHAAVLLARAGGPVLVTHDDEIPPETARALTRLKPRQVVVLGNAAAVPDDIATRLGRYAGGPAPVPVTRVDGDPRETSVAVAERFEDVVSEAYLVSLADPAGALAAAVLAARTGAPVLVTGFELTEDVEAALARLRPEAVFIVGGPGVIGPGTEDRVRATLR